jgi:TRAP transporter TAXI family solute receptor
VSIAAFLLPGCGRREEPPATAEPQRLLIATGAEGGAANAVGTALASLYNDQVPGVKSSTRIGGSVEQNLDALEQGEVELAFVDSETAYVGLRSGTPADHWPHTKVRAIAVLFPTVVHVFTRRALNVSSVADLEGTRLAVGQRNGYADQALATLLTAYHLSYPRVTPQFGRIAVEDLHSGALDGAVIFAPIWHSAIARLVTNADLSLLSLDRHGISRVQAGAERNHFLKSTIVPRGTYPGQDTDVLTVGEDTLLLCREDLPDALAYRLTRILFESVAEVAQAHPAARAISIDRGATASIPLHPGALQYYRERDLPR